MARNGGAKKIAVNGVYLISVLRLKHFDLISDALPFGRLCHGEPDAIDYAKLCSRSHDSVIRVYVKESTRRSVRPRAAIHLPNR
jgi:hypothetical protein